MWLRPKKAPPPPGRTPVIPYRVIKEKDLGALTIEVGKAMSQGWRPTGGVAFGEWHIRNEPVVMQAMIWKDSNNG